MKKRFLTLILSILTVLTLFSAILFAEAKYTEDTTPNWQYIVPVNKYDYCELLSTGLIKVALIEKDTRVYGLIDRKGNLLTEIIYSYISDQNSDGYMSAKVKDSGEYFLFDKTGKTVQLDIINIIDITVLPDLYYIETETEFYFYIDDKTHVISKETLNSENALIKYYAGEYKFNDYYDFYGIYKECFVMRIVYENDGNDGNNNYNIAVVFNWDGTVRYKTVFAYRCINTSPDGLIMQNSSANQSLIDFDGNTLIAFAWSRQISSLWDYESRKMADGLYIYTGIDDNGKYFTRIRDINNPDIFKEKASFESVWYIDIENKLLCLSLGIGDEHGLYSFDGTEILPFGYSAIGKLSDGLIRFQTKDNKFGLINIKGEVLFETDEYILFWDFSEGFLGYTTTDGVSGFLDKNFKPVIKLEKGWNIFDGFKYGLAAIANNAGEIAFINREGKVVMSAEPDKEYHPWKNFYRSSNMVAFNTSGRNDFPAADGIIKYLGLPGGDVLYSSITAYINDHAVPTSVINGKTLVVVEDLAKYGFDVKWDNTERTLKAEINKNKAFNPLPVEKDITHKSGAFKCHYMRTDIRTYLSGEIIESYAIDGVTLIDFELLKKYGKLKWDGIKRELRLEIQI